MTGVRFGRATASFAASRSGASSSSVELTNTRRRWSGVRITRAAGWVVINVTVSQGLAQPGARILGDSRRPLAVSRLREQRVGLVVTEADVPHPRHVALS